MYTATEARAKINSESFRLEEYIDRYLEQNFRGKELCVPVSAWTENIIWDVLNLYKKHGWNVRAQNINPGERTGSVYFSFIDDEG